MKTSVENLRGFTCPDIFLVPRQYPGPEPCFNFWRRGWVFCVQSHTQIKLHGVRILPVLVSAFSAFSSQESPRQTKPKKGKNEKFMNFALFCELWCFSLGKQARFTLNFVPECPCEKVHEPTFLWFGLPGPLLIHVFRVFAQWNLLRPFFWGESHLPLFPYFPRVGIRPTGFILTGLR